MHSVLSYIFDSYVGVIRFIYFFLRVNSCIKMNVQMQHLCHTWTQFINFNSTAHNYSHSMHEYIKLILQKVVFFYAFLKSGSHVLF